MSTMIDRWNRINVSAEGEAQSHPDEIRASRCEGQAHAIKIAIDDFMDACTPRVPRAEWFEKWDAWLLFDGSDWVLFRTVRLTFDDEGWTIEQDDARLMWLEDVQLCVPVAREGFPAPVSWKVVE